MEPAQEAEADGPAEGSGPAELERGAQAFVQHHGVDAAQDVLARLCAADPGELRAGSRIGAYTLGEKIGEGGMGVVFRARQDEPITRTVAIKLIKPGMDSGAAIARFGAERQALARMDHPHIARVFDAGATATGRLYFVMEHVEGVSLSAYCDARALALEPRLRLFVRVCGAVQHAHQRGIIHRDLKPSNVLVREEQGAAVPKIIDFGLAKAVSSAGHDAAGITRTGTPLGTLEYMSPEQAGLGQAAVDTRTDVYALGVILYRLLTGTMPFEERALQRLPFDEARRIVCERDPTRPSARRAATTATCTTPSSRSASRSLRGDLDWITLRALEKDPARRYQSPADLADDIERHLRCEPVRAGPPGPVYRLAKLVQRRRALVSALAAVSVALLAGLVFAGHFQFQMQVERVAKARAERQAGGLYRYLLQLLTSTLRDGSESAPTPLLEVVAREATAIEAHLGDDPLNAALIREVFGRLLHTAGSLPSAEVEYRAALELLTRAAALPLPAWAEPDLPRRSREMLEMHLAALYIGMERFAAAEALLRDLIARDDWTDAQTASLAAGRLALTLEAQGRHLEAESMLRALIDEHVARLGPRHDDTMERCHDLGCNLLAQGRADAAARELDACAQMRRAAHAAIHSPRRFGILLRDLGLARRAAGLLPEAHLALSESHAVLAACLGSEHKRTQEVVAALIELHEGWDHPGAESERATWRARLTQPRTPAAAGAAP